MVSGSAHATVHIFRLQSRRQDIMQWKTVEGCGIEGWIINEGRRKEAYCVVCMSFRIVPTAVYEGIKLIG